MKIPCLSACLCILNAASLIAVQPEVAELNFSSQSQISPLGTNALPSWFQAVEQDGGQYIDDPLCWHVDASQPAGRGRLALSIDRRLMQTDLALGLMYEENTNADIAVQLFDANNQVVALDLFYNLVAVGSGAQTDTFVVPLRKYPTATKILIRRIVGDVKVYGVVLCPVVTEVESDPKAQHELAILLGDPLSPENPLIRGLQKIATAAQLSPGTAPATAAAVQWKPVKPVPPGERSLLVDGNTPGYYNAALGTVLDGTEPHFPRPLLMIGITPQNDPTFYPASEPTLAAASAILGNWLTPSELPPNTNWVQLTRIPSTWAVNTETAIIYEIDAGCQGIGSLRGDFDVDNGIYVWVNGKFKFGARAPGLLSPGDQFEYQNIDLGSLPSGKNYIQVLREDSGIANGYKVRITGSRKS
jgi:hypothetical protein